MTEGSLNRPEAPALGRPDPFDRLLERLGAAPIDPWLLGIVVALSLMAAGHVFVWASGGLEPGRTNRLLLASAVYGPYALAALLYLRRVATRSLERFWPATGWPVEEMPRWRAAFATGPARIGLPALVFGVVVGVGSTLGAAPGSLAPTEAESRAVIPVLIPISIIGYGAFPIVVAQAVRHLRLVSRIHREAGAIDPFDTRTVHAFSVLTSQIGLAFVAIGYFSLTVNGEFQAGNPIALGVLGTSFAIGTACFVAPLWGIHGRLVAEKERRSAEIEQRADRLAAELYRRIDGDAVATSKEVGDALAALGAVRDRIARLPTWPWPPQLLRGFISALVIPAVVYVLGRLLAQQMAL